MHLYAFYTFHFHIIHKISKGKYYFLHWVSSTHATSHFQCLCLSSILTSSFSFHFSLTRSSYGKDMNVYVSIIIIHFPYDVRFNISHFFFPSFCSSISHLNFFPLVLFYYVKFFTLNIQFFFPGSVYKCILDIRKYLHKKYHYTH